MVCTNRIIDVKLKCIEYFRSIPINQRTATAMKSFYENTIYPEISGDCAKVTIYLATRGFSLGRHSEDIYFDVHEREDVVHYRQRWAQRMMAYRSQMREYDGEECEVVIRPTLALGSREIVQGVRVSGFHVGTSS
ncbi:hypothetical protein V1521DRAFT_368343 [Lipomyces starkeyi]